MRFGVSNHSAHAWHWFQTAYGYDPEGPRKGERYDAFKRFAAEANADDAGAAAAANALDVDLGETVRHFLEREDGDWAPNPAAWDRAAVVEPE